MIPYHKIDTPFKRSEEGDKKLIIGEFRDETMKYLAQNIFDCTEKIDGTNIGIVWDGHDISFQGRKENSTIPLHLLDDLNRIFMNNETEEMFEQKFGKQKVILYGEGYGNKLQTNGNLYIADHDSFILFDVYFPDKDLYLRREDVEDVAKAFGIDVVPIVMEGNLYDAINFVRTHPNSMLNPLHEMEGLVLRPKVELRDRQGNRVIVKVKYKDFKTQ